MTTCRLLHTACDMRVISLWHESFGDSETEIRAFLQQAVPLLRVYALEDNSALLSMLCCLDTDYTDESGEIYPASYVYAVCTAPSARKKGYSSQLLRFAEANEKHSGKAFLFLVPASASLAEFYRKLGYCDAFSQNEYRCMPDMSHNFKCSKISADAYWNLRQMLLFSDFVSYDTAYLKLQQTISESTGAGLYRIETDQEIICAAAEVHSGVLLIKEMLPYSASAASFLCSRLKCNSAIIHSEGTGQSFGMCKILSDIPIPSGGYLGLALD